MKLTKKKNFNLNKRVKFILQNKQNKNSGGARRKPYETNNHKHTREIQNSVVVHMLETIKTNKNRDNIKKWRNILCQ